MNRIKLEGTWIGDTYIESYAGDRKYYCTCKCGYPMLVPASSLLKGYKTKCTHEPEFIVGDKINEWTVLEKVDKNDFKCRCSCGKIQIVSKYDLKSGQSKSCGHSKLIDLTGKQFGEWNVIKYAGSRSWLCRCSCGKEKVVNGASLRNGDSTSCGHKKSELKYDLAGQIFGEWTVLNYVGHNKWKCRCSCGKIATIGGFQLRNKLSTSCGHDYNAFKDITGQQFGELTVLKYIGNRQFICKCSCGKIIVRYSRDLRNGSSKSCGHLRPYQIAAKLNPDRTNEQIAATLSKEVFRKFIGNSKPNLLELSHMLGVTYQYAVKLYKEYESEDLIDLKRQTYMEDELYNYIKSIYGGDVIRHNRDILNGKELDIYIPELKTAIEFNGTYWHSTLYKDKEYHQQKTLNCIKAGIRLIHIFEYEWIDEIKQEKLKLYLADILQQNDRVYARDCEVRQIDQTQSLAFLEKYHLQGDVNATVKLGLYEGNDLIAVMTFGKPRFNTSYQYELLRLCFKPGVTVVGGKEKLISVFINEYNPDSIICYSDMSKFTGNGYLKLGFTVMKNDSITEPSYVWVNLANNTVLSRYQTQKDKLIKLGYSNLGNTENEIMENLGYVKVYNSGSIKFIWNRA